MSTSAAPFARTDAHARPRRIALGLTIGVHLLAAWVWLQQRPLHPPRPADTPGMVTILLHPIDAAHTPLPAPLPASASPPAPPRRDSAPAVRQLVLPPLYVPPPDRTATAPADSLPATPTTPATGPAVQAGAPDAATAPGAGDGTSSPAPAPADGGFAAGLARRQAGRIDRELRGGKSGVPTEADTPWARFQRGVDAAHVESSLSAHLDSYTSPDGVVIYRRRVGSRTSCYQTGSVGVGIDGSRHSVAGTHTGANAGNVACPSGVTWTREE